MLTLGIDRHTTHDTHGCASCATFTFLLYIEQTHDNTESICYSYVFFFAFAVVFSSCFFVSFAFVSFGIFSFGFSCGFVSHLHVLEKQFWIIRRIHLIKLRCLPNSCGLCHQGASRSLLWSRNISIFTKFGRKSYSRNHLLERFCYAVE